MPTKSSAELITLRGGVIVPADALRLAWRLEERGLRLAVLDGGALSVGPRSALTDADREEIRTWRADLATILTYEVQSMRGRVGIEEVVF